MARHFGGWVRFLVVTLVAALFIALGASYGQAAPYAGQHVEVELIPETTTIEPGKPFTVGLRVTPEKDWHSYWLNAGDAGMATSIKWSLPAGFKADAIQWPAPWRVLTAGAVNYGYDGQVMLLTRVVAPANLKLGQNVPVNAHVSWLVCAETCIPGEANLSANVKTSGGPPTSDAKWADTFAATRHSLPMGLADWRFRAESTSDGYRLIGEPTTHGAVWPTGDMYFFDQDETVIEPSAKQPQSIDGERHILTLTRAAFAVDAAKQLRGMLVAPAGWRGGAPAAAVDTAVNISPIGSNVAAVSSKSLRVQQIDMATLSISIVFGLIGGLILNLMPCVFPVLGLKVLGFVEQAGSDRRKVTMHGLAFTAGVLISFWALAALLGMLRASGDQLGWGFQLQSPDFVFLLAALMLVFAMNLSGVFEFGVSATSVGSNLHSKSGLAGTFFTGFLATIVATPCSAPFLAPALGAALTLPVGASFVVFTAIGIGLSLPYLLLSLFPSVVRFLPRPGRWMETFKQVMAFPLYATVAYLIWVLAGQTTDDGLLNIGFGLVLIAMGLWAYGRWSMSGVRSNMRFAVVALLVLIAGGSWLGWPRNPASAGSTAVVWDKWSPETVAQLRGQDRMIYVDFTARWCATCQANRKVVFNSDNVLKAFAGKKIVTLRADWTNKNPAITAELARYQRSAIPFDIIYKPGEAEPMILPEVLTPGIVLKAVS